MKTINGIRVFDEMPKGWKVLEGALCAPNGYKFICNGKSRFKPGYENALLRESPPEQNNPRKSAL